MVLTNIVIMSLTHKFGTRQLERWRLHTHMYMALELYHVPKFISFVSTHTRETSNSTYSLIAKYPPSSTEVDHLREEVTTVKDKLQSLDES